MASLIQMMFNFGVKRMRVGYNLGMNDQRQKIGRMGEGMAADYLIARGLLILDKNVRTPYGEIDLVAGDGEEVVFVEVKTRTNLAYGYPETAITPQKFQHIVNAAQFILHKAAHLCHVGGKVGIGPF